MQSISLPKSVQSVGSATFKNCTSLTSASLGGNVDSISSSLFYGCINLQNAPSGSYIGDYAFYNCTSITSVNITRATYIGSYAFYGCSGITTIQFGQTLPAITIGSYAFAECSKLSRTSGFDYLVIPSNVQRIGNYAFYNCSAIKSVWFHDISWYCFKNGATTISIHIEDISRATAAQYLTEKYASYSWQSNLYL